MKRWLCPTCGRHGNVVQVAPYTERRCNAGHRWADGAKPILNDYIPLTVRLEEAGRGLHRALDALAQAEVMIKDCASFLTPEQRVKLAVGSELYQLEQTKATVKQAIKFTIPR